MKKNDILLIFKGALLILLGICFALLEKYGFSTIILTKILIACPYSLFFFIYWISFKKYFEVVIGVLIITNMAMNKVAEGDYKTGETVTNNLLGETVDMVIPNKSLVPYIKSITDKAFENINNIFIEKEEKNEKE